MLARKRPFTMLACSAARRASTAASAARCDSRSTPERRRTSFRKRPSVNTPINPTAMINDQRKYANCWVTVTVSWWRGAIVTVVQPGPVMRPIRTRSPVSSKWAAPGDGPVTTVRAARLRGSSRSLIVSLPAAWRMRASCSVEAISSPWSSNTSSSCSASGRARRWDFNRPSIIRSWPTDPPQVPPNFHGATTLTIQAPTIGS